MISDREIRLNNRIEQILKLSLKLVKPHEQVDSIAKDEDKLDQIIAGLNLIAGELEAKSNFIQGRTHCLNEMVEILLQYTLMDFSQKMTISNKGDELDAIALGLNTLGEELESHIDQLNSQAEELQQSNQRLDQFVYIASHDLQEPLKTLANYVNLFQEDYQDKFDKNSAKYLDVIKRATERMRLLIIGLLEYAQLGQKAGVTDVDCNMLLEDVLHDMAFLVEESGATIEVGILPVVKATHSELRSLFQNLISNSIKFRKTDVPAVVKIEAKEEKDYWLFSIQDNGIGIEKEFHDRIFFIFQKLNNSKQYAGTGIGLAHCKKIVEILGGRIWVESKEGTGSIFYFTINKN